MTDTVNVPRDPSLGMLEAAERAGSALAGSDASSGEISTAVWSAMLAAAPKAEPVDGTEFFTPEEQIDWLMRDRAGVIAERNHAEAEIVRLQALIDAQPEAPKVEQKPSFLGHVITYPDGRKPDFAPASKGVSVGESCTVTAAFSHPWHPAPASDELLEEERELDASDYDVIDRSLKYVGTVFALHDLHEALTETMARTHTGYDWNADPDGITLKQGNAIRRYETLTAKHKGPQS